MKPNFVHRLLQLYSSASEMARPAKNSIPRVGKESPPQHGGMICNLTSSICTPTARWSQTYKPCCSEEKGRKKVSKKRCRNYFWRVSVARTAIFQENSSGTFFLAALRRAVLARSSMSAVEHRPHNTPPRQTAEKPIHRSREIVLTPFSTRKLNRGD